MEQDEQQEGNRQVEETGLRRRKIRRRVPSTSSSSSSSSSPAPSAARSSSSSDSDSIPSPFSNQEQEENGNGQREQRDEDEQERPQVLDKEKTKCAYRALRDMRRRSVAAFVKRHFPHSLLFFDPLLFQRDRPDLWSSRVLPQPHRLRLHRGEVRAGLQTVWTRRLC